MTLALVYARVTVFCANYATHDRLTDFNFILILISSF